MSKLSHLNRDRDEIRVPDSYGESLLHYLGHNGLRGRMQHDCAGDVITLDGEPDMGRVAYILADWERRTGQMAESQSATTS